MCLAIPLLQRVLRLSQQQRLQRGDGTRGIVVLPTRELAQQAAETFSKLAQLFPWLTVSVLAGPLPAVPAADAIPAANVLSYASVVNAASVSVSGVVTAVTICVDAVTAKTWA